MSTTLWPGREQAWQLLNRYTKNPSLIKHALAVEAVMQALAERYGEDPDLYARVGLLHDFDYEAFPEIGEHTIQGGRILAEEGFPDLIVEAIRSHVNENGIPRDTLLKRAIYAADELTGFIVAATLVRPNKSLSELTPKSVIKKLKDKSFAKGVNRNDVYQGAEGLGIELDELIQFIINALIPHAEALGLNP
ncbi:HDIG domain-containing metalloprotein [Sulfobacillus thermosulfidooxidans]|uniref:HDIG domain-containing protein n=2 Tax=Sulfobacillus thermosulfidooxidans TaxID=28034 RepID=A0A1W1W7N3_SULTA|nr:HDIG domain-containing metalloprotein [Sulfobacillus thermosulfidooxidans]OLZ10567.1 HAD family hydrolase [Sulfobacillus thermosulfidooxidans]OLZ16804.1 HAD family hydrolase [Sulfobacillus thermosulfidooxidans]OLZ22244.1 HAD family hydrolase [Sulfobacillus thermosulfidooxidans]PSR26958.1 MAG: HDIG domain-containing protein [Sulfobacillus thermosulfidooxidans]SMC02296.1 HDIG domain-containing protein [Sulfobacillus thermosulfidooxidans DSM 9293]